MHDAKDITVVTERGQVSIPAHLRRELALERGKKVLWERVNDRELRVTLLDSPEPVGPEAMRGFARTFRETRRTADWMAELREGET